MSYMIEAQISFPSKKTVTYFWRSVLHKLRKVHVRNCMIYTLGCVGYYTE